MSGVERILPTAYSNDSLIVVMLYMYIIQYYRLDVVLDLHLSPSVTVVAEEAQPPKVAPSNRLIMLILIVYDRFTLPLLFCLYLLTNLTKIITITIASTSGIMTTTTVSRM